MVKTKEDKSIYCMYMVAKRAENVGINRQGKKIKETLNGVYMV